LLLSHLNYCDQPSECKTIGENEHGSFEYNRTLRIGFPPALRNLEPLFLSIAKQETTLDWRLPAGADNDVDLQLKQASNARQK
jgi:hypothetical protein